MIPYNPKLKQYSREMRKDMTPEEKKMWYDFLKKLPYDVKRQHRIEDYIVDFYIAKKKTVIEIDGKQHLTQENKEKDENRTKRLNEWGIKVIRYSNSDVNKNFNRVAEHLLKELELNYSDLK